MSRTKTFLIIDGNALIHRAYHAIPQTLFTKKHELVNAVYGFTSMLLQAIDKLQPEYIICTFDASEKSFRNELYPQYKEHRKHMDAELVTQLNKIHDVIDSLKIPIFQITGFEADDVIGTLAQQIKSKTLDDGTELSTLILTGDRDLLQLLDTKVQVILPGKSFSDMVVFDKVKFKEKYSFSSDSLIDYKALYGDTSDNIPGVKKIGEKTATDLIKLFPHIEDLYEHLDEVKPATRTLLEVGKELAFLSKKLATINTDVAISFTFEKAYFPQFDQETVVQKFLELEFKSLLKKLPNPPENDLTTTKIDYDAMNYTRIESEADVRLLVSKIKTDKLFAIDCETTSLDIIKNNLVGISFGFGDKSAFYLPLTSDKTIILQKKSYGVHGSNKLLDELWDLLSNPLYEKVGHNIKFDMHALQLEKISLHGIIFDTMIASHVLNNKHHDLKGLIAEFEEITMVTYDALTNKGETLIHDLDLKALAQYACADADMTFRLYLRFKQMLQTDEALRSLYYQIELPLIEVLFKMEQTGVKLDVIYLEKLSTQLALSLIDLKKKIFDSVGHEFNINSPKQLSEIIHGELQLPKGKKTKTGYSTDERYFNSIGDVHPIVQPLRLYKELTKLKSTYVDALPKQVDEHNRLHTSYNQTITSTGRLSSTNPNLQNIPVRSDFGKQVRNAFIADSHSLFLSFDYSQFELRIMAHLSQDKKLKQAFLETKDIHYQTGQLIFNKDVITSEERRIAKTINFGIIYGISAYGLAGQLGIDRNAAQQFIDRYFETFPQIRTYIEDQKKQILENHFTTSLMGRKRTFPEINSVGSLQQQAMIREGINMPLQAANAEIIKIAMEECQRYIEDTSTPASMILQIHDELIFEYKFPAEESITASRVSEKFLEKAPKQLTTFTKKVCDIMEHAAELSIPIQVEYAIGESWGTMTKQKRIPESI